MELFTKTCFILPRNFHKIWNNPNILYKSTKLGKSQWFNGKLHIIVLTKQLIFLSWFSHLFIKIDYRNFPMNPLLIMGKTLDTYQKDKKIFIFLPCKGLLRYFQRLVCRVRGEFCDIHAALETSRALLNVSQVHVRTQNASK